MPYIVEVTVKSQKGTYAFGHKVGDKIIFDGKSIKGDICYSALMVLLPKGLCHDIRRRISIGKRQRCNIQRMPRP